MKNNVVLLITVSLFVFACKNKTNNTAPVKEGANFNQCLVGVDWCYPSCSNPTFAWKFLKDGTFSYSTALFGGMSAWGNWSLLEGGDIKITYTKTTENKLPESQVLKMEDCNTLKVGTTIFKSREYINR